MDDNLHPFRREGSRASPSLVWRLRLAFDKTEIHNSPDWIRISPVSVWSGNSPSLACDGSSLSLQTPSLAGQLATSSLVPVW